MKKLHNQLSFFLCLILCLSTCISALAVESLRVQGISDRTYTDDGKRVPTKWSLLFKENYPSVKLTMYPQTKNQTTAALLQTLKNNSFKQDVFSLYTFYHNPQKIMAEGFCVDLAQYTALGEILAQMHPSIVKAVSYDGRVYGMPISIMPVNYLSYDAYSWHLAGLTEDDVPTSFSGLLGFLENWVEKIRVQPMDNISITSVFDLKHYNENSYTNWLMNLLHSNYVRQCEYQGTAPDFNLPVYLELADRIKKVGELLYQYSSTTSARDLFFLRSGFDDALNHLVPLRMTEDDPIFLPSYITMLSIGSYSQNTDLAAKFIENYMNDLMNHPVDDLLKPNHEDLDILFAHASLFWTAYEPVPGQNYGGEDENRAWIERARAELADKTLNPKRRAVLEESLPIVEFELEEILNGRGQQYTFTTAQLTNYQKNLVPALYFPTPD